MGMMFPMGGPPLDRHPLLDIYDMNIRRTDTDFHFDFIEKMIVLDKIWIDMALSEKETYGRYKTATLLILAAVRPWMLRRKAEKGEDDVLVAEYESLRLVVQTCDPVEVSSTYTEGQSATESFFTVSGALKIRRSDDYKKMHVGKGSEDPRPSSICCPIHSFDSSMVQASENGYSIANCTARNHYFAALELAFCMELISMETAFEEIRTQRDSTDDYQDLKERYRARNAGGNK